MDPLATAGELNLHLQREVDPDRAAQALQLASGAVRAYCGWGISQTQETLFARPDGTYLLTLPTLRLNLITEVRYQGTIVDSSVLHMTSTRRGQVIRYVGWPSVGEVEVDCDHGFAEIPDVIKLVVLEQAAKAMSNPEGLSAATVGRVSKTFGGVNSRGTTRLTELDQRLLDTYQI